MPLALVAALLAFGLTGTASATGRVDNPYAGARAYVNPEWSARAAAEPGGAAVAGQPTAVWLDSIAAVSGSHGRMSLRDHLDEALRQGADLVQVVLHDIPGRDCGRLNTNGELTFDQLPAYRAEFVDPIARVLGDPAYARLRVVAVVEPNSLPFLVTHVQPRPEATLRCEQVRASDAYHQAIGYALARLGAIPNVHNYLDVGHHGHLGWDDYRAEFVQVLARAAGTAGSTLADVHGFVANTSNYSALDEIHLTRTTVGGQPILQSRWVDWNPFVDELSYAEALRRELVAAGFDPGVGVVVDTSRNGWGGPNRPTGPNDWTSDVNTYVDTSRLDRRLRIHNWCNQVGAGLGERPAASPVPGVDAYAWVKPPGESDGASSPLPYPGENHDRMCDPNYDGPPRGSNSPSGAAPNTPPAGQWHPAGFRELLANAHPPL
ncbi:glycoside hydrolase family 6 protein [Saccharothrix lopnurensis]|uniref:Glucanase n=1 Tax=Saccharothrix lopnurensis TaxID=1670621 RepID=A0ABW1P5N9_9PSEU